MEITKSTRHSKIAGNFGEALLLYWLSKHGFECATVDHTGIDLIATNRHTGERMGISVKSRTRTIGTEDDAINIPNDQFEKATRACDAWGLVLRPRRRRCRDHSGFRYLEGSFTEKLRGRRPGLQLENDTSGPGSI